MIDNEILREKSGITIFILSLVFCLIFTKLLFLQIVKGSQYEIRAKENSSHIIFRENAPRGIIYDRESRVLASNRKYNSLVIIPSIVFDNKSKINKISLILSQILNEAPSKIKQELLSLKANDSRPFIFRKDLNLKQVATLYENQYQLPGFTIQHQSIRYYVYGSMFAHVLGYTGNISENELKKSKNEIEKKKDLNDIVGKYGIEKSFDNELRGMNFLKKVKVNKFGQPLFDLNINEINADSFSSSGKDIKLTLDLDIQKVAFNEFKLEKGAVIVINPKNGEILALVSKPSFDPNIFTSKIDPVLWSEMQKNKTLLNRALSAYFPGSIWKPISMIAALEKGTVKADDKMAVGAMYCMGHCFHDWTSKKDIVDPRKALAWSRNTAFYPMADYRRPNYLNGEFITFWGKNLGMKQKTGIELEDESIGSIPEPDNKEWQKKYGRWNPGDNLSYVIGQGYITITPAQAVRMISFFANKGEVVNLHLIKEINSKPYYEKLENKVVKVNQENLKVVREGLLQCVESGTGQISKFKEFSVAGKTGSAENPPQKKTHGWFAAFAPYEDPEIAVVVFGESAGHGGSVSAPIAQKIFEAYFKKYRPDLYEKSNIKKTEVKTNESLGADLINVD